MTRAGLGQSGGAGTGRWPRPAGISLTELVVAAGIVCTLAALSMAPLLASREPLRAAAAGRYLASVFQAARLNAVQRGRSVGIRFDRDRDGYGWMVYADGNDNGIRIADITSGIDAPLEARRSLPSLVAGVDLGSLPGVPQVDSSIAVGDDPIRFGSSDLLSFSPDGTSSSGTVYVVGRGGHAWAVRVLGATARIRLSRYDSLLRTWVAP
ncbi:MAG: GspH/FimT family protein [Acidobacteriota bacterium]